MREVDRLAMPDRRRFLARSQTLALALAAVPLVSAEAFAEGLPALSPATGATLVRLARDIFPHDRLSDDAYRGAITLLAEQIAAQEGRRSLLETGVAALDKAAITQTGRRYAAISEEQPRLGVLRSIQRTDFFAAVRSGLVTALYNQQPIWDAFHYEGSSAEKGGYLHRGFNDIDWLPV